MENIYLGIDFGNTNIKVSIWNKNKKEPRPLSLGKNHGQGDKILKNYIYYGKNSESSYDGIMLGERAKELNEPNNSVNNIKGKLCENSWNKYISNLGKEKNIVEVLEDILGKIKIDIEEKHGKNQITNTVITVPVNFSEIQKNRIKKACKNINLPLEAIVTEPVAASINFDLFEELEEGEKALIFDFGGGTLDLVLFDYEEEEENNKINILSSYAIKFGGKNIDDFIFKEILEPNIDFTKFSKEERERIEELLLSRLEKTKENIFFEDEDEEIFLVTEGELDNKHKNLEIKIEKKEIINYFDRIEIRKKIYRVIDKMLDEVILDKEDIKRVKMIGGSSRIKYFQECLKEYFEDEDIIDIDDIDEDEIFYSVASGACRYLLTLIDNQWNWEIRNTVPYEILVAENGKYRSVIDKNSKYDFYCPKRPVEEGKNIEIYQKFQEVSDVEIEEKKVYIGQVKYNKEKYKGVIYYSIGTNIKGEIICKFYDSENLKVAIEEFKIN